MLERQINLSELFGTEIFIMLEHMELTCIDWTNKLKVEIAISLNKFDLNMLHGYVSPGFEKVKEEFYDEKVATYWPDLSE